jgi:hypothetical protein
MFKQLCTVAFACVLLAGCRDDSPPPSQADLSMTGDMATSGGGDGGAVGDMAKGTTPKNYKASTVAAMRQAGKTGDFELDHVTAIGLTPSKASPKLVVQDATGGDFSAMLTQCSAKKCTVQSTVSAVALGHSVTVKGTYFKTTATGAEDFNVDTITDEGVASVTPEAPLVLTETDIKRGANVPAKTYRKATVTPSEDLVMYSWSPVDLTFSGTWPGCSTAPLEFGFSMAPKSAALTAGKACTVKTSQPVAADANDAEILIGTDFYKDFKVSSDCQCSGTNKNSVPTADTVWPATMPMTGILFFDVRSGATVGHLYFSPMEPGVLNPIGLPPT